MSAKYYVRVQCNAQHYMHINYGSVPPTCQKIASLTVIFLSHHPTADSKMGKAFVDSTNSHVRILSVPNIEIKLDHPVMIAGFADKGLIGSICANQIVEQLHMHQIGFVESHYVMPAALFIGKKFRHPFRLYSDDSGRICVLICEVPILLSGAVSLSSTITDWAADNELSEIIVAGGIVHGDFVPPMTDERVALLLMNEFQGGRNAGAISSGNETSIPNKMAIPESALLPGLAGGLLSSCATKSIPSKAVVVPTIGNLPDPEGAAIVLESLDQLVPGLSIDTSGIRKGIELMRERLREYMKMHERNLAEYEQASERTPATGIYK